MPVSSVPQLKRLGRIQKMAQFTPAKIHAPRNQIVRVRAVAQPWGTIEQLIDMPDGGFQICHWLNPTGMAEVIFSR